MLGSIREVGVATFALALAECQGDGNLTTGLEALAPEAVALNLYGCKGDRSDGITTGLVLLLCACRQYDSGCKRGKNDFLHVVSY